MKHIHLVNYPRRRREARYQSIIDSQTEYICRFDAHFRLTYVNRAYCEWQGKSVQELIGVNIIDLIPPEDRERAIAHVTALNAAHPVATSVHESILPDGSQRLIEWTDRALFDADGQIIEYQGSGRDVTERHRQQILETLISDVSEAIAEAQPLSEVLDTLVLAVEAFQPGIKASVLLLDHTTQQLRHVAARSLPPAYCASIDGTKIGANTGSCGTAAYEKRLVIVENIETDPLWDNYRHLTRPYGLRACWSQPIIDHDNKVLGTFALYYTQPRRPGDAEIDIIRLAAHLAGIAIRRQQAEDALRASEKRYRQLFEVYGVAKLIIEPETGRIVDWNGAAAQFYGFDVAQLNSLTIFDLTLTSKPVVAAALQKAVTDELLSCQLVQRGSDGQPRDVELFWGIVEIEDKTRLYAIVVDITEKQRAKAALQQAHDLLERRVAERTAELEKVKNRVEAIFNHSGDGLLLLDTTKGIQQANFTFDTMFAVKIDSYIGTQLTDFIHPEDREITATAIQKVAVTHQTTHLEIRAQRPNGTAFDIEISIAPVNRSEKAVRNLVCIIRDVTERKQAERAIAEERNLLRTLVDAIPEFIYIKDRQHRMILNNAAQLQSLGITRAEDAIGRTDFDLFPQALAAKFYADEVELFRSGQPIMNVEERTLGEDGSEIWAMTTKVPLRNLSGEIVGLVGITHDVTKIKANEEALLRSQADLQSVIDSTTTAFVLVDENGIIRAFNRAAQLNAAYFGSGNLQVGHPITEYLSDEFRPGVLKRLKYVLSGENVTFEQPIETPNEKRYYEVNYYPVFKDNGEIVGATITFTEITGRRIAEQQLRYLASLQEYMYDAVIGTDLSYRIQSWNKAAERMFGWKAEEAIGRTVDDLLCTEILSGDSYEQAHQNLVKSGYWSGEAIQHHRDGTPIYVLGSVVINSDTNGVPIGIIAVNHDITARKAAEAELERKRQEEFQMQIYLRALHRLSIDLARADTLDDFYRLVVEEGLGQFGFERMALLLYDAKERVIVGTYGTDENGKIFNESSLRFETEALTDILKRTLNRNERFAFTEDTDLHTQLRRTGRGSNAAAALWNGEMLGWLVIDNGVRHQPITRAQLDILGQLAVTVGSLLARKRAEFALKESEEKFRLFVESAPISTIVTDADGQIVLINRATEKLFGYQRDELIGEPVEVLIREASRQAHKERRIHYTNSSEVHPNHPLELPARCKDGTVFPADVQLSFIEMNPSPLVMSFVIDVTERKLAEEALKQALNQEIELGELKSRFISMASHEFRTPLAAILATTDTLTYYRKRMDEEQIDTRLDKIRQQVSYMKEIMEDVLELARIQAGRAEFKPSSGDLDILCHEIIEEFESQDIYRGRIVYDCQERPVIADFDKRLMRQILGNLVANALKYSADIESIRLELKHNENHIIMRVQDDGIGIPPDDLKRLFEPFHRAANVGTISGTGLGLSITKQAVELHNGTIIVESELGIGTAFTVTIPRMTAGEMSYD